ncbi:MAG: fibronectin type III domain-containing protein, partial [Bacteroidales bacterium]|nr:fibronectin type III domain-containing protein [Bacteroidales bacterium]
MNRRLIRFVIIMLALLGLNAKCNKPADPQEDKLAAPESVVLHSATKTSLTFQWNPVTGATAYEWKILEGTKQINTGTVARRNVVVEGLTAGTQYQFAVRSVKDDKTSDWSKTLTASTEEDETPDPGPGPGVSEIAYEEFKMPADEEDGKVRAFPGAEGCGMLASGGRGGAIYHVTKLEDDGSAGTLRWALGQKGARTIVFDVAGRIALKSNLKIKNGDLTIAGQTAPGDGIVLTDYSVEVDADNVIIRYMRFRMGDEGAKAYKATMTDAQWSALKSIPMEDAIWGREHKGII